eukprot:CAMPEP_0179361618 /NCGR_PEP_ID=MMETSP0797-20121207/80593_1 /TAXON_ID=47934 /ORGANISM="Dinophysis acuminata, Strain DAEP01" /LENGTH=101 /DNA_ID=CAMNT_0021077025 /DNA_START=107 /DNA_END=412 /DNA_ORIENTATION=-
MDLMRPGVFQCRATMGQLFSDEFSGYSDYFQVAVDGDKESAFYPNWEYANSGEMIVNGPDGNGPDNYFVIRSLYPNAEVEITLELNALDRRKIVTWTMVDA